MGVFKKVFFIIALNIAISFLQLKFVSFKLKEQGTTIPFNRIWSLVFLFLLQLLIIVVVYYLILYQNIIVLSGLIVMVALFVIASMFESKEKWLILLIGMLTLFIASLFVLF